MTTNFNFVTGGYVPTSNFNFGVEAITSYSILVGTSNNFSAVWADPDAGLAGGKLYVANANGLSVINLADNSLYDAYTETRAGRGNETLNSNDIVDINVGP
jgi:hypothetical protein